jgi:uncharacterized protein (DUF433 family)
MYLPESLTQAPDSEIHLTGHRIGLFHIVRYYNEGHSAEMLVFQYPTLPLSLVHKVIAWYLDNREAVDDYVGRCQAELTRQQTAAPRSVDAVALRQRSEAIQMAEGNSRAESA